jgi:acyl-CoA synthetase (AMP-forming)/AMP-acid ligase II
LNIAQILSDQAALLGEAPAIIEVCRGRDRALSFRDLESASARFAEAIVSCGIGASDCVLILHPMKAELYAFLIALFRVGAVGLFLDPSAGREHVERCLRISPPKAFLGSAKAHLLRLTIPALRRIPVSFCTSPIPFARHLSLQRKGQELSTIATVDELDLALITFTSGSTGEPKAALRTHGFLVAQHRALQLSLDHRSGAVDLTTLPVFVLANLASGVTSVIPDADLRKPGRINPRPVIRQLQRFPITTMAASPAFVSRLTEECRTSSVRVSSVKRVFMGGAPVFPSDLIQAQAVFPLADISAVYGSTEAEPMAEIALSRIDEKDFAAMEQGRGLLAGRAAETIALRIVRDSWGTPILKLSELEFQALCLAVEHVGEIVVSGDHVLHGYLNGVGDDETKIHVNGTVWHRTGDLGRLDIRGRLWLLGRASAAITDERGTLYPFAVECAARQVPGVRCAAILSIEGRRVLVLEANLPNAETAVRERLAWAHLDEIRLLRSIPSDKRHNAKVDYVSLRKMMNASK